MRVAAEHSYKGGQDFVQKHYAQELAEINRVIAALTDKGHRSPSGSGRLLPGALKRTIRDKFGEYGWDRARLKVEMLHAPKRAVYREIDFVKNRLGVDVQFGRVALMGYNALTKMPIFKDADLIDAGVQIVPVKDLAAEMSGTAYFEQLVWDLERRGEANTDIPVLILGIAL